MYKRRLQKMGAASLGISLPKRWLSHYNLKQGDEVDIEILPDYTLLVKPSFVKRTASYSCQVFEYDESSIDTSIMRLVSLYINGVDSIRVLCGPYCGSFKEKVYGILERNIIGLEVIEEGEGFIVIACLVDILSLPLLSVIGKMGRLVTSLMREVESAIRSGVELDVEERDSLIDKLYLYSIRQLNMVMQGRLPLDRTGLRSMGEAVSVANLLKILERMGDHVVQLYKLSRKPGVDAITTGKLAESINRVRVLTESILNEYLPLLEDSGKPPVVGDALERLRAIEGELESIGLDASMLISLTRILAYLRDVIEVVMDITVSRMMRENVCGNIEEESSGTQE